MAAITVGTGTPVAVDLSNLLHPVIQNLGPGVVYLDATADVTANTGVKIDVNVAYEFLRTFNQGGKIYLIASQANTSVRTLAVS